MAAEAELVALAEYEDFHSALWAWEAAWSPLSLNGCQRGFAKLKALFLRRDPFVPKAGQDSASWVSNFRDDVTPVFH